MPEIGYARSIIDDTPVNGELEKAPSSNWAYDHAVNKDAHHAVFVNRGDSGAYDFTLANLITDGAWRDLDLSAIVPAGALAVLLLILLKDDSAFSLVSLRRNGNTGTIAISRCYIQVADTYTGMDRIVALDAGRVIEYATTNTTFNDISILVKGWWI